MFRQLLIVVTLSLAVPATAATVTNTVRFGTGGLSSTICAPPGSATQITSAAPIFQEFSTASENGHCQQNSVARAGGGSVGVRISMQADRGAGVPLVDVIARSRYDFMLGVPEDWSPSLIPLQVDAQVDGSLAATILSDSTFGRGASASLRATVQFSGFRIGLGSGRDSRSDTEEFLAAAGHPGGVPFGNLTFVETLSTGTVNIDPRRPVRVEFEMIGSASGQVFNDADMTSDVFALNSLGFVPGASIFDLPEGFTLNAPEMGIVDNRFVGFDTDPSPAVVPLPAAGMLLLGSLALLAALRRCRQE